MNKFGRIMRDACSSCWGYTHPLCPHTHTNTYSQTPIFRASHGMSSSAIQLRISVLQLNSAIPEQNERPKPSGEKSADNPKSCWEYCVPATIYPVSKKCKCVRECWCICVCGFRGAEREFVCIPFIPLLTDAFSCTEPGWPYTHNNFWITVGPCI